MSRRLSSKEAASELRRGGRRARNSQRGGIISKLISLISFILFLVLLYFLRHPILRTMGDFWIVADPPSQADAIVVLADDNYSADRAAKAADLYREHYAPLVVASGHMLRPYFGIGELMKRDLTDRGVPATAIIVYPHQGADTLEEARVLRSLIVQRGWSRLLIVTSNYHTRRARYIWRRTLPSGVNFWMAAAPDRDYDPDHWWETRGGVKTFAHELLGMPVAMWELRHASANDSGAELAPAFLVKKLVADSARAARNLYQRTIYNLTAFILYSAL
jgi:uncharacterized SAM-binding protein YcdF (DUF218 family)